MNEKIQQYFRSVASVLQAYHDSSKTMNSPTLLGDLRERFVREALYFFLPSADEIHSGQITDCSGRNSNQQDIVIYRRDMPKLKVTEGPGLLLAEGAKATIEVKSGLTWDHFRLALENVASVRLLSPKINPFATGEKAGYIFCYVFAYEGPSDETVIDYYNRYIREKGWTEQDFFSFIPDALYILNGPLFYKNDGYVWKKAIGDKGMSPPFCKSDHPVALDKFFLHLAIAVSYPDIFTIDWKSYLT